MQWARNPLELLVGIYMNIRALMAYDLLTIIIDIQRKFKLSLVQQYQKSDAPLEIFAIAWAKSPKTQLSGLIMQYNESNLKAYSAKKARFKNEWTERLTLKNDLPTSLKSWLSMSEPYNWAAENTILVTNKFMAGIKSTQKAVRPRITSWSPRQSGPEEKWTEVDRLKAENRLLRPSLEKQEMEMTCKKNYQKYAIGRWKRTQVLQSPKN